MSLETTYGKIISFLKFDDFTSFPVIGKEEVIYRDIAELTSYMWDTNSASYINLAGLDGTTPTLQAVSDVGNITTRPITAASFNITEATGGLLQSITASTTQLVLSRANSNRISIAYPTVATNQNALLNFANVTGTKTITFQNASGTVAYLTDITDITGAQNLQQVATLGNTYTGNLVLAGVTVGRGGNPTLSSTLRSTALGVSALAFNLSTDNTAVGNQALGSNSGGTWNTAIGSETLSQNINGNGNTAIGYQALKANISGGDNTAIGQQALAVNLASNNVAIGLWALKSNTTGAGNLALGRSSIENNITGINNVGLGLNAMRAGLSGDYNVGIGANVMSATTSLGQYNVGIGLNTLLNSTGNNNIGIGLNAGSNLSSGNNNILIGQVLALTTSSSDTLNIQNIIFGSGNSGTGSTLSTGNIGIGITSPARKLDVGGSLGITGALFLNGSSGTFGQVLTSQGGSPPIWSTPNIGDANAWHKNGDSGTTPGTNFIGTSDAQSLVFKVNNTVSGVINFSTNSTSFGYNSLNLTETGGGNTAYGKDSLHAITIGTGNSAFGLGTLSSLLSGNFNTGVGNAALANLTTGASNVGIGVNALSSITTGSFNVGIGFGVDVASATSNGQLSIQNIIYGINNNAIGSTISTGSIGIGTKTPGYKLEVAGTFGVSGVITAGTLAGVGTRIVLADTTGSLSTSTLTPNSVPYINSIGSYVTSPFFTFDGQNMNVGDGNLNNQTGLILNGRGKLLASVSGFSIRIGGNDNGPVDISKSLRIFNQTFMYYQMGSASSTSHYANYSSGVDVTFNGNVSFNNNGTILLNNSAGTVGQVLTSNGPGAAPIWTTITGGGSGTITGGINGLTTSGVNIKLGGTLSENTTIARSTFDLIVSGPSSAETRFGSDYLKLTNTALVLSGLASDPVTVTSATVGSMYYNTAAARAMIYIGGSFRKILTEDDTNVPSNRQPGDYTLALTDKNKIVEMNSASPNTLTIPNDSTVLFPNGSTILVSQYGAGQTTIVGASGVTIRSAGGFVATALQYSILSLLKIGPNEWYLCGDTA